MTGEHDGMGQGKPGVDPIWWTVGNQQKWHTLRPERSGVLWRSCKLPDFPVVLSSPFNCLSLYLPSAL